MPYIAIDYDDASFAAAVQPLIISWHQSEKHIKEVELFIGEAVIPAINELRYAGRQLHTALNRYTHGKNLPPGAAREAVMRKVFYRLSIADQYFTNCKHDIVDAAVSHVKAMLSDWTNDVTKKEIAFHFNGLNEYIRHLGEAERLIAESREAIQHRKRNYDLIMSEHISHFRSNFQHVSDAYETALYAKTMSHYKATAIGWSGAIGLIITIWNGFIPAQFSIPTLVEVTTNWVSRIEVRVADTAKPNVIAASHTSSVSLESNNPLNLVSDGPSSPIPEADAAK